MIDDGYSPQLGEFDDSDSADNFFGGSFSIDLVPKQTTDFYVFYRHKDDNQPDLDPTNNLIPAERHITTARGRDFSDVSPLRGVILGSGAHHLSVAVDVLPQA